MGLAGILSTGYAVKNIDKLSNISYHVYSGTIIGFQYNGVSYRYFDAGDFLNGDYNTPIRFRQGKADEEIFYVTAGFYEETKFLAYLSRQYDYAQLVIENKFDTSVLSNASIGVDTVKIVRVKSTAPYSQDFKYEEVSWLYQGSPVYDRDLLKWIIPDNASYGTQSYDLSGTAGSYYANNIQQITTSSRIEPNDYGQAAGLLGAIALVIDQIVLEVFPLLDSASEFGDFITAQKNYWRNELIHTDVSLQELNTYNTSLVALYESVYRSQNYLNNADGKNKLLKLGAILSESALRIVPLSKRIEMLQLISRQSIEGEVITVVTQGVDREALTIRIVNSVQPSEADLFLEALAKMEMSSSNKNKTLFELLYNGIDNGHLLVGVNNLDRFMQGMYRIWLLSAYNPKDQLADEDIKEKDLNNVVCINYKTDTAFLFFSDTNYYFEFAGNQILVKPDDSSALLEEQSLHMFRCMILMGTEHISGNQQIMEVHINGQQEMAIPLFYLKYIDDKKATDNLVTGIQIGVDIALTLAPIGNLSKLTHITRLTKFGRAIAGKTIVEGPGEVLLRLELAQGVVSAVEITAGLASIYYSYAKQVEEVCDVTSSKYDQEKCINYRRLADLFMYIGLVNGVLDVVAARKVKNVAKKILDSPIANTLDSDVYKILKRFAEPLGDVIEATNTFWIYVRDPKNKELLTQGFIDLWENTDIWTEALRTKFITDFSAEVGQLRYFQTEEMLARWRHLATRDILLSGNIKFLQDPVAANRLVELFDSPTLRSVYTTLLDTKTRSESLTAFLRKFDDLGATYYQQFAGDSDLVKSWFRYFDDEVLREDFFILSNIKQVSFVEIFGDISEIWIKRFKGQPYLFDRFNTAVEDSLLLAKQNPKLWIRINRYYQRPNSLGEKLTTLSLQKKYKNQYAETLVDAVENKAQQILDEFPSRTYRDNNFQLISGMVDKNTGVMSDLFSNFPRDYFDVIGRYESYRNSLHPNIQNLIGELEHVKSYYNMDKKGNLDLAGYYIAAHAEIRAVDDLAKKKFGNLLINDDIFVDWLDNSVLGYNRNLTVKANNSKVIMARCADCYYITSLLNFIE